jgi:hypothetical protein
MPIGAVARWYRTSMNGLLWDQSRTPIETGIETATKIEAKAQPRPDAAKRAEGP